MKAEVSMSRVGHDSSYIIPPSCFGFTTLAILAGGAGSRMGRPKGLLTFDDQPILEHLLDRLAWAGPTLLVTAPGRQRPPGWQRFGAEVVDPSPDLGPLCGVLTALRHAAAAMLVVTAVDMPAVEPAMLAWLVAALDARPQAAGAMVRRTRGDDCWVEPFPAAFNVAAARGLVAARFDAGDRSVRRLTDDPRFVAVDEPPHWPATAWANVNDPAALDAFLRRRDANACTGAGRGETLGR